MAKELILTDENGKEYTLTFTRKTVKQMEARGFVTEDIRNKPLTALPMLFEGAFLAKHRHVKKEIVEDLFDHISQKDELIEKLGEMYAEPIQALFDEPDEDDEKNVSWTANW